MKILLLVLVTFAIYCCIKDKPKITIPSREEYPKTPEIRLRRLPREQKVSSAPPTPTPKNKPQETSKNK